MNSPRSQRRFSSELKRTEQRGERNRAASWRRLGSETKKAPWRCAKSRISSKTRLFSDYFLYGNEQNYKLRIRHGLHGLTRLFYVIIALKPWNPCNPCLNIFFSDSFWIDFRHKNKRTYFLHSFYSKFVLWGLCLKKESLVHISTVWSSNRVSGLPPFTFSFPPQKKEKTDECLLHRTQVIIEETLE